MVILKNKRTTSSKVETTRNLGVSENGGTPKSSILIGFSIINHPFWGTPIFGTPTRNLVDFGWFRFNTHRATGQTFVTSHELPGCTDSGSSETWDSAKQQVVVNRFKRRWKRHQTLKSTVNSPNFLASFYREELYTLSESFFLASFSLKHFVLTWNIGGIYIHENFTFITFFSVSFGCFFFFGFSTRVSWNKDRPQWLVGKDWIATLAERNRSLGRGRLCVFTMHGPWGWEVWKYHLFTAWDFFQQNLSHLFFFVNNFKGI